VTPGTTRPQDRRAEVADRVIPFPTRRPAHLAAELPVPAAGRPATARTVRARRRVIREAVVLEVDGRLSEVVEDLDLAIQLALAEEPRGVVCDLSAVLEDAEPVAVEVLATAGRHVRDWPGIPLAVSCPDRRVREMLAAHPLGGHLIVSGSLFSAINEVLASPALAVERLKLAPHPVAPRASRDFVTRTLRDWRLGTTVPFASLVVSELVASSARHVGTDIDLSVAWSLGALRLAVRDHGPAQPRQPDSAPDLYGRGPGVVAGLARAFGFLPAPDGGQVVWAVLDAPRSRLAPKQVRSGHAPGPKDPGELAGSQDSPRLGDGSRLAALPGWAGSRGPGTSESFRLRLISDHPSAGRLN